MTIGFTGELPPERFNLARYCIAASARRSPDKVALSIADGESIHHLTFAQIEDTVLRLASSFALLQVPVGERIFIRMGNSFDYAAVFFAANAAGMVPIPASSMLSAPEVDYMITDSGASVVVHDGKLELPVLDASIKLIGPGDLKAFKTGPRGTWADTAAKQPGYMVYTSGTSGTPKGVLHAQRAVWGRRPMYDGWYGISSEDVLLHTGAFNWTYTLGTGLFDPWANGASSIVYTGPRDRTIWLKLINQLQPTIMAAVPALYRQLLADGGLSPSAVGRMRHGLTAGEACPVALMEEWEQTTGIPLYEALGMSEISTYVSSSPKVPTRPGSPGKPQAGLSVAIPSVNSGETPLLPGEIGLIALIKTAQFKGCEAAQHQKHNQKHISQWRCKIGLQLTLDDYRQCRHHTPPVKSRNTSSSRPDGERCASRSGASSTSSLPCAMMMARVHTAPTSSRICVETITNLSADKFRISSRT